MTELFGREFIGLTLKSLALGLRSSGISSSVHANGIYCPSIGYCCPWYRLIHRPFSCVSSIIAGVYCFLCSQVLLWLVVCAVRWNIQELYSTSVLVSTPCGLGLGTMGSQWFTGLENQDQKKLVKKFCNVIFAMWLFVYNKNSTSNSYCFENTQNQKNSETEFLYMKCADYDWNLSVFLFI